MNVTPASSPPAAPTTREEYEKFLEQGRAQCGLPQAEEELKKAQEAKDKVDLMLTLPRKQRIHEYGGYDLKKGLDISIRELESTNRLFAPMCYGYIFGVGGLLSLADKMGMIPYSVGMPLVFGFIGSCFASIFIARKLVDKVIYPRRMDKRIVAELTHEKKENDQKLAQTQVKYDQAQDRFTKWRKDNDLLSWITGDKSDQNVAVEEDHVNIDGVKIGINKRLKHAGAASLMAMGCRKS